MSDQDRRVYPRFDLMAQVTVRHGSLDHVLEILNLSRGGALVDLSKEARPRWLELHRPVELHVFDGEGRTVLATTGKVVRVAENVDNRTFAIEFDTLLDDESVRKVLRDAGRPPPLPEKKQQ